MASLISFASASIAQVDFTVSGIEVNQGVQINGTTPLTGGRSTMVRTTINLSGFPPMAPTDGILRVFVDGIEASFSPVFSDNGPIPIPTVANPANEDDTLNFIFIPPVSNDVVFEVEVNPMGPNFTPETDTTNNLFTSTSHVFEALDVADFVYSPVDLRPGGGGTPNLPDPDLIKPGVGDNFIQGCFPGGELLYRRTDAPSKLWTSSVQGSGSALISSLNADLNLMSPRPDRIYGWVPGSLPYNGQAQLPGVAGMGNTQNIRHQRTYAHEMGHTFGFFHISSTTGHFGVDVENHLNITESLPVIKNQTLFDIMVAGLLTNQAWIGETNYLNLYNNSVFQTESAEAIHRGPTLYVGGAVHRETGQVELYDVFTFEGGTLTKPAAPGRGNLGIKAFAGEQTIVDMPILSQTSNVDGNCSGHRDSASQDPLIGFSFVIPAGSASGRGIDRLQIDTSAYAEVAPFELRASVQRPRVAFASSLEPLLTDSKVTLDWGGVGTEASSTTKYYLCYSPDGERMIPLMTSLPLTRFEVDLAELPAPVAGKAFFEVMAADGLHTTKVRSTSFALAPSIESAVLTPEIHVMTPDSGKNFLQGATVILHAGTWDIDDQALLDGADVQWTSNLDGLIGTGRHTSVSTLSVGVHTITVEGTDSDGMTSTDTTKATIVSRGLPLVGTCQTDLGFGGPGNSFLSVCGGDLSTGTTADLLLTNAPASTNGILLFGLSANPTPFKGGMLVPVPFVATLPMSTDSLGEYELNGIAGGIGPLSLILQFVLSDPAQIRGVGLSNAVQLDFLP